MRTLNDICDLQKSKILKIDLRKDIMNRYMDIARENLINGHEVIFPNGIRVCAMTRDVDLEKGRFFDKQHFFKTGEKKYHVNPHMPNKNLVIALTGYLGRKWGYGFKASQKIRKEVSKRAFEGQKFKEYV